MKTFREPTSIVEMAEGCRRLVDQVLAMADAPDEERKTSQLVKDFLPHADFYELDDGIVEATDQVYEATFTGHNTADLRLEADCRLPSKVCAFWSRSTMVSFESVEGEFPFMYLAAVDDQNRVGVIHVSPYFAPRLQGIYEVEKVGPLTMFDDGYPADLEANAGHTLTVAAICTIINQPSFTLRTPAGSRQERRAATRAGGYAVDAWHRITWNIGEAVKAKLTRDEPVRCMPLHYTRGHWRRATERHKNSTLRKDGGWYQWIDGYWSGHPAFGISKSYHAPKLKGVLHV